MRESTFVAAAGITRDISYRFCTIPCTIRSLLLCPFCFSRVKPILPPLG